MLEWICIPWTSPTGSWSVIFSIIGFHVLKFCLVFYIYVDKRYWSLKDLSLLAIYLYGFLLCCQQCLSWQNEELFLPLQCCEKGLTKNSASLLYIGISRSFSSSCVNVDWFCLSGNLFHFTCWIYWHKFSYNIFLLFFYY